MNNLLTAQNQFIQLIQSQQLDEALQFSLKLLEQHPQNPTVLNMLGDVLLKKNQVRDASQHYQHSISIDPLQLKVLLTLGKIYEVLGGHTQQAFEVYSRALELEPSNTQVLCRVAEFLSSQGHFEDAMQLLHQAIFLNDMSACSVLLNLYERQGDKTAIRSLLLQYQDYFNHLQETQEFFVFIKALLFLDEYSKALTHLQSVTLHQRSHSWLSLYYKLLGDCHEQLKNYQQAVIAYQSMNQYIDANYNSALFEQLPVTLHQLERQLPSINLTKPNKQLIYIVGMPRTGSSLLEKIISTDPSVYAGGELELFEILVQQISQTPDLSEQLLQQYYQQLDNYCSDPSDEINYVTDKMPTNFFYIGLIKKLIPQAKIIYCQRDPLDTCFSIFKQNFTAQVSFATKSEHIAHFMSIERAQMDHWLKQYPQDILTVSFELLLSNFEQQSQNIFKFLNLKWNSSVDKFYKQNGYINTASYNQIKQPLNPSVIHQYQGYLPYIEELKQVLTRYKLIK